MKNLIICILMFNLPNMLFGQENFDYKVSMVVEDLRTIYDKNSPNYKLDTLYYIYPKNWDYEPIEPSMSIETVDGKAKSYIPLFRLETGKKYKTYLNGKLIQYFEFSNDSTFHYQEFKNEMSKYLFYFRPPNFYEFTIMDDYEMELKTTYKDSTGITTIEH